jgi:hypothetical protein
VRLRQGCRILISQSQIPEPVNVTKIFTFRRGTNTVVQMNDGVDVLALRALAQEEGWYDEDEEVD